MRIARVIAMVGGAVIGAVLSAPVLADPSVIAALYPDAPLGDFNGDGVPDALLQPPTSAEHVRTVTTDGSGATRTFELQAFPANFLGLGWATPDAAMN